MNGFDFFWGPALAPETVAPRVTSPPVVVVRRTMARRIAGGLPSFVTNPPAKEGLGSGAETIRD